MPHLVGAKGQVVIDKAIRDALGIMPGALAVQRLVRDHVEIRFLRGEHRRSLRGALAKSAKRRVLRRDWKAAREEAWAEAARGALRKDDQD
jgi:bifunctional DNA-binding transcriptional regulator/antitoxin component of YhaV-PrlF toxin-antitoxin module